MKSRQTKTNLGCANATGGIEGSFVDFEELCIVYTASNTKGGAYAFDNIRFLFQNQVL